MKNIHQKLLATFQIEHHDHVEQIRSLLAMIETTGAKSDGPELEEVFRRAHSLKGAARAVDLQSIEGLAHRLETLFSRVRQGECALDKNITTVVQQVLDASEDCIAALAKDQTADSVSPALRAIEQVLGIEASPSTELFPDPQKSAPQKDTPQENVQAPVPAFQSLETVRITTQNFEGLFRTAGGLITESQRENQLTEDLNKLVREIALIEKEGEKVRHAASAASGTSVMDREHSRLTVLLDSMGRQVRSISRQARAVRSLHNRRAWNMRQLGEQLQRDVWKARMVPAESLLEGFRRMMRDLARDVGKEIEFQTPTAAVSADRGVLEALKDPIMHLLRNAVSHGIESLPERTRKGKRPAGLVTLRIGAEKQRLIVTVEDDGRGVDFAQIARIAVREGILSESEAVLSSPEELTRILFRAGFSTSPEVTSLSGRGMGLSVVYEAIRRLQGDLELLPVESGGAVIRISVPLFNATHRLMVVACGKQAFAIPIHGIERLRRVKLSAVETVEGKTVIVLDGQPLPLASIHGFLGLEHSFKHTESDTLQIVILRSGSYRIALGVDAILRETDSTIQDLGPAAGCGGKLTSGTVLDDGTIAFVVNPLELIQSAVERRSQLLPLSFVKSSEPLSEPEPASILVVDDSMTTRTLEKSILEAHGYQVRVAVDGVEALACLRQEAADLVIADIEMPRLNGYGLIEAMKHDSKLKNIPVIIVSSLERREDQERGLALGADAYIVKRKFDQSELLAAIRQIL